MALAVAVALAATTSAVASVAVPVVVRANNWLHSSVHMSIGSRWLHRCSTAHHLRSTPLQLQLQPSALPSRSAVGLSRTRVLTRHSPSPNRLAVKSSRAAPPVEWPLLALALVLALLPPAPTTVCDLGQLVKTG